MTFSHSMEHFDVFKGFTKIKKKVVKNIMSVTRCLIKQGTKLLVHEERTVSPTTDVDHKII